MKIEELEGLALKHHENIFGGLDIKLDRVKACAFAASFAVTLNPRKSELAARVDALEASVKSMETYLKGHEFLARKPK